MNILGKALLTTTFLLVPFTASSQTGGGTTGGTDGLNGADNYVVDNFSRTRFDYTNATHLGGGMWSGIDQVIVVATIIRPHEAPSYEDYLFENWDDLADLNVLA
ncbi:hypothetical protein [Litorimonas haliclonae]|uniref:hypothetical protein n=1 Tax=Litorimonas haliclonae TaxID=2081977 RepID=UPI0039EFCFEC